MSTINLKSDKWLSLRGLSYGLTSIVFGFIIGISLLISIDLNRLAWIANQSRSQLIPEALGQHGKALQVKQLGLYVDIIAKSENQAERDHALDEAYRLIRKLKAAVDGDVRRNLEIAQAKIAVITKLSNRLYRQRAELEAQLRQAEGLQISAGILLTDALMTQTRQIEKSPAVPPDLLRQHLLTGKLQMIIAQIQGRLNAVKIVHNQQEIFSTHTYFNGLLLLAKNLLDRIDVKRNRTALEVILEDYQSLEYLFALQRDNLKTANKIHFYTGWLHEGVDRTSRRISGNAAKLASKGADDLAMKAKDSLVTALVAFGVLAVVFMITGIAIRVEIVKPAQLASSALEALSGHHRAPFSLSSSDLKEIDAINLGVYRLAETLRESELANQRLIEMAQVKSNFTSSVSHELRTPLTSVRGFINLIGRDLKKILPVLRQHPINPATLERADRIVQNLGIVQEESERLTMLVDDLLDIAKIESGTISWRDRPVQTADIVRKAVKSLAGELALKPQISLRHTVQDDMPVTVLDPQRMHQVMLNLCNNAIKFTEEGMITIRAWHEQNKIYISIQDTGIGIDSRDLERIFEKFQQGRQAYSLTEKPKGTGLGLAICRQIVENYGGTINVDSSLGKGTTFTVILPVRPAGDIPDTV